ncbi:MAG: ATP-binding protein, partial [Flavobacteriales bacterium]
MSKKTENNYIKFNFDVSAYRLLGRELITDRITALFEIVKNAYDANADNVEIKFCNVTPKSNSSKIIIKDDGLGMKLDDLKNRWMVIGTSSKRRERTSPSPYNRKVVGKKGIGRFAVDLLGSRLVLKTKQKDSEKWICLETNWSTYFDLENKQLELPFENKKEFFTDIKNKYWFEDGNKNEQGTILEIDKVNDEWTEYDVSRAYKELSKLVSPNAKLTQYPFNIQISSQFDDFNNKLVKPLPIVDFATKSIILKFDKQKGTQQIAVHEKGDILIKSVPKRKFGFIEFTLFYFDQDAKRKFKGEFNLDIDGIKIYRDGIITTPFAEHEANQNKQKDILGIDKRRYSGFFEKVSSRDLLGYIEITDNDNSTIVETTNRQDFIDNNDYTELKLFIIEQIEQIEKALKYERENAIETTKSELSNANTGLKAIKRNLSEIKKNASPEVKKQLRGVEANLSKLQGTFNKSMKDYTKLEQESKQKESLFFSLVSLQTYA